MTELNENHKNAILKAYNAIVGETGGNRIDVLICAADLFITVTRMAGMTDLDALEDLKETFERKTRHEWH